MTYTFRDTLDRATRVNPTGTAVVCGSTRLTFEELDQRCRRLRSALLSVGLEPGDRVAVVASNCHVILELYLAVPLSGMVIVPLNARHTETELTYALRDSGSRMLFIDHDPAGLSGACEHVVRLDLEYEAFLGGGAVETELPDVEPSSLAGLFYTGGTTGASKGVMLTHSNLIANALHTLHISSIVDDDVWLIMAPMFHAAGTMGVLASVWSGIPQVISAFDPSTVLDLIERESITTIVAVPTMLAALLKEFGSRPRDVGSVRRVIHGGAPISKQLLAQSYGMFQSAHFIEIYGSTELSPLAAALFHEERIIDQPTFRACGQQIIGVDVRVVDEAGDECATGAVGEIAVRGPNVMQGYWNKPEQTAAVLRDGWYRTGDLGYMDDHSRIYLVDRAKDMIITGGENVYSTEVEEVLYAHPAVVEAAVYAIPDDKWGERVHAAVVVGRPVDAAELIQHCRTLIADYKVPKDIELRAELPKSAAGKILKRDLREPHWVSRDSEIA